MPPPPDNDSRRPIYTFSSGMTPLSFSSTLAPIAHTPDNSPQPSFSFSSPPLSDSVHLDVSAPSTSMSTPSSSRPHGKRRDPSYIPRPPNAFILFRCAFIKEQNVPGKVEGNHSRLSKIIGLCWKQLPPEEKEKWEAQAVIAQAEHRAHYPDWRFRPGANAMAKLKIKEAGPSARRRIVRSKVHKVKEDDGEHLDTTTTDPKGKGKMKASSSSSHTVSLEETRCAKIAGFVAEGIKGEELEEAVKQWEGDHSMPRSSLPKHVATKSKARKPKAAPTHSRTHSTASITLAFPTAPPISEAQEQSTPGSMQDTLSHAVDSGKSHSSPQDNENGVNTGLSGVPLTHMFKRATSAPAPDSRVPLQSPGSEPSDVSVDEFPPSSAEPSPVVGTTFEPPVLQGAPTRTHTHNHGRRDTISFPLSTIAESNQMNFASSQQLTWQEAESQRRYEEAQHHDSWSWQQAPQAGKPDTFGYVAAQHPGQQQQPGRIDHSAQRMSYEIPQGGSRFDQGYLEQYGSYYVNEKVEPGQPKWTNMADSGRQGVSIAVEDPYEDDCVPGPGLGINVPPPSIVVPLSSDSDYYYTQLSPHKTPSFTSSSFSTLRDWAGEYKDQPSHSESPAWPNSIPQSPMSGSWYSNPENIAPWGSQPPPLQQPTVANDAEDWNRHEYRTSSSFNLPVEPLRQVTFHGELLAQQQQRQHMS
jgi:hypothetical protein